jgi:DNA polymerase-3 subunit epsilon
VNTALFYDSETTGLPLFSKPSEDPGQPHIVQLAAALVDLDTRQTIASFDVIARPDGWTIPDEVSAIHGITTEHAQRVGIPEALAVDMLLELWQRAYVRIGHNESFDARIVRIAHMRLRGQIRSAVIPDAWKGAQAQCTALQSTPICKLPPTDKMRAAGINRWKTANLGEAYLHFTGKPLDGAHSAMNDVQGCMAVYFGIKDLPKAVA